MRTEAERQLKKLIAIPTVTHDTAANDRALEYIESYLAARGMHTQRARFNSRGALVASTRPDNAKQPAVLLAAHVDVVVGSDEVFNLRYDDTKLYGRGVYDMKFAIASYMQLVDELRHRLQEYNFAIMITSDEEIGLSDGTNSVQQLTNAGHLPGVCILPDSTAAGWDIEKRSKGVWRFDLIAQGRPAHASRPWEGESASSKLIKALHELDVHFQDHGHHTDTLNIGLIHGGKAFNQIPTEMTAGVEIRLLSDGSLAKNQAYIQTLCEKYDLTAETYSTLPPMIHDLTAPAILTYMDSVQTVTGRRPQPFTSLGGSDAGYFIRRGIPCIVSCPAGGGHHSENEWLDRASFAQFVPILRDYLEKMARTAATPVDSYTAVR